MDDGVDSVEGGADDGVVAQVAVDFLELRMLANGCQWLGAEHAEIENAREVAGVEQTRDEHGADVARPAGDEDAW